MSAGRGVVDGSAVAGGLRLTVVGPAPAYTRRPGRPSACHLVELKGRALVLDLGQGGFSALAGYREPAELDAVLISHLHLDHCADLVPLRHYLRFSADAAGRVGLHGPTELRARFDAFTAERDFLGALPGDPLAPGPVPLDGWSVEAALVTHTAESYAFRVSPPDGRAGLVYSGDCGRGDELVPLLRSGDTLLAEASFGAGLAIPEVAHLTAGDAADAARDGGAARLVLTHILDEFDERDALRQAHERFDGEIVLAEPGTVVDIP